MKALQLDGQHADEDGEIHEQPGDTAAAAAAAAVLLLRTVMGVINVETVWRKEDVEARNTSVRRAAAAGMSESGQRSVEMRGSYNVVTSTNLTDEKLEEQQDGDEGH